MIGIAEFIAVCPSSTIGQSKYYSVGKISRSLYPDGYTISEFSVTVNVTVS